MYYSILVNTFYTPYSQDDKSEEGASEIAVEAVEGDVQGNVQIKMVVSNGKVILCTRSLI